MSSGAIRETVYSSQTNPSAKETRSSPPPELKLLNQRLDTLRQNHIPSSPYVLAIQSRRQFHLSDYQVREEFKESETGFKPEERDLQYLTFLPNGWNQTILSVLKPEQTIGDTAKPKVMASANTAPKSAAKKISIDDYHKKRSSLPARNVNGSAPADNVKNRVVSGHPSGSSSSTGLKRSSDVLEKPKPRVPGEAPPAKKLKPSPSVAVNGSKSPQPKAKATLPPSLRFALPALLEKSLSQPADTASNVKSSEPVAVKKVKQTGPSSSLKSASRQESSVPKRSEAADISAKPAPQISKTVPNGLHNSGSGPHLKPSNAASSEKEAVKTMPMVREKSASKPSVIVRLKIPKDRRKDVYRLLKLPSKAERERKSMPKTSSNVHEVKKAVDRPSVAGKLAEKRPREEYGLDVKPAERKRSRSPAHQEQVANKKLRELTPVSKDEVMTPQGAAVGTPIPPTSVSKKPRDKPTPPETGNTNPQASARLDELRKLQNKYSELGRALKKEGDKLSGPDMSPAQMNKFIASRIETTLAFMLSYTIGDEVTRLRRRALTPEFTWDSLFKWLRSVHELVNGQPHLSGLLLQLEAISLMVVWRQRSDIAETEESISLDKVKELRAQCEEAQRKFIKGSARLSVDDLQNEFPKTWKTKATLPLAHIGYKLSKDNLNGDFYLPLTSISLPIEGVRAGKIFLAEWCRREGVDWTAKLEFW